ncbi:zinc/cadmium/mercury/lead-transporting ATPase [Enterobacterales bacterium CwR94]|nr:zinc/cadmium/mercury/lead-transporting ATPase [Enterobacterales bacterium CwR94]
MSQHHHCGCGHQHTARQTGCSPATRPTLKGITSITPATATADAGHCCSDSSCSGGDSGDEESDRSDITASQEWKIQGMDCPSCARKIETAVRRIPGVSQAQVLFTTEKLRVVAAKDLSREVEAAVAAAGFTLASTQPSAPTEKNFWQENLSLIALAVMMLLSEIIDIYAPDIGKLAFTITTLAGVTPILRTAWRLTRSGTPFAIETLMSVAAIGALFIGATAEAAMVLLLFMLGERLEAFAAGRARKGITALMALKPETAVRITQGKRDTVAITRLQPGDIIEVTAGGRLPADAELYEQVASFDESALTGESIPVERQPGERIAAGSLSVDRTVRLKVVSEPGNSAIDRILHLIEEAESKRAPVERFIDSFSRYYTPAIMAIALLVAIVPPLLAGAEWQPWIYKALTLLLIGCPCALVISTPAAITSGLAAATRRGALIKGGAALETLSQIDHLAFDKTGTLTQGKPEVTDFTNWSRETDDTLLAQAGAIEQGSAHPLAKAIAHFVSERIAACPEAQNVRALPGSGIEGTVAGEAIMLCAPAKLMPNRLTAQQQAQITALEAEGKTVIVQVLRQYPVAIYALRDQLRPEAKNALKALQALNIRGVMLTGDNPRAAAAIAGELGIDYRASLLPADKVAAITALNQQHAVAMVGDGINDAPAMKAARIGIAMGGGSDVALETADCALTRNHLGGLASMIRLARATRSVIRQNIAIALGLKALFLITTLMGLTGLWLAVLADSGATALVTANALRLLRKA